MSAEQDPVRALASRIAQRVSQTEGEDMQDASQSANDANNDLASVRKSLEEMKRKLATIEEHLSQERGPSLGAQANEVIESVAASTERGTHGPPTSARSPWLSGVYVPASHPSQERFGVEEAAVSELVDFFEKEKVCELDPSGKPCDHCAMCSSRGF